MHIFQLNIKFIAPWLLDGGILHYKAFNERFRFQFGLVCLMNARKSLGIHIMYT